MGLTANFALGVVFTTVEMLSMLGTTVALIFLTRTRDRTAEADSKVAWLKSLPQQPLVDVLICTYKQPKVRIVEPKGADDGALEDLFFLI